MLDNGSKLRKLRRKVSATWSDLTRNAAVLKSWEYLTRTAGLGAIGLSLLASGEQVNPISLALGSLFLVLNTYLAYIIGALPEEK
jgi:hypothetical protein